MAKILLVEDDREIAGFVERWFVARHHLVDVAETKDAGSHLATLSEYDVYVFDWNLPDGSGLALLKEMRQKGSNTPALILTANRSIDEKEQGFITGADDYLTKPFEMRELSMRVEALLKRARQPLEKALRAGDWFIDRESFIVKRCGVEIKLLPKEFDLLEFLMRNPNKVFSSAALLQRVWHTDSDSSTDTVMTTMKRLRKKIDSDNLPPAIETIFGVGYKFVLPED